jgi:hypothetical protein
MSEMKPGIRVIWTGTEFFHATFKYKIDAPQQFIQSLSLPLTMMEGVLTVLEDPDSIHSVVSSGFVDNWNKVKPFL